MTDRPILPGFHPDPSICRAGEEYLIATSTFEYAPGVPIHRSTDLVTWELVGHALPDAVVINAAPGAEGASQGIFAPTLRHHDGLLWMTTTSIRDVGAGQLITHAERPEGPWSAPIRVPGTVGIDPDLAWDDDGTCLLTWRGFAPPGIHQVPIDPRTGERLGEEGVVWQGTGLADTEGPHLIRRGDWWYLIVAEGGTHLGHGVSVARSRSPRGPFEAHPSNPFFSHRSTPHPVQAVGHADLVELADGSWAMVHLGIRQTGSHPGFHVLGRETFLAGVEWVDDWPVIVEDRFDVPMRDGSFRDDFEAGALDPRWVAPSTAPDMFASADGVLLLEDGREPGVAEQGSVLCARVTAWDWDAHARVAHGDACLSVRIDASHWYGVELVGGIARARAVSAPFDQVLGEVALAPGDALAIRARAVVPALGESAGPDKVSLGVRRGDGLLELATLDGRYLATELAGGFTGRMIGLEALSGAASIEWVSYQEV
ncbi:family 43 glycosylhydrolase [Demequina capsici]|uniref:Family 43 glycosylhydrolase n=1 Tax=Demequina capsici TaxID=3075620 RepID=A0AA96FDJ5_9MICO|nr:family 43 glycosylhydrolase [Demequina sp. PMTSA13]WNM26606.1 family 43 glycosylhydrolase [Demequina sp. PMTSA13]